MLSSLSLITSGDLKKRPLSEYSSILRFVMIMWYFFSVHLSFVLLLNIMFSWGSNISLSAKNHYVKQSVISIKVESFYLFY